MNVDLKQIFNSTSINEANYVKSLLESYSIEVVLFDEATASLAPHYVFSQGGVRVMVRDDQYNKAKEIVDDYLRCRDEEKDVE